MGNVIYDAMERFAGIEGESGFMPICAPTGIGKSYAALEYIFDLHEGMDEYEKAKNAGETAAERVVPPYDKVVFLSTRNALVDDSEYMKRLKINGREDLASQVCSLPSNASGLIAVVEDDEAYASIPRWIEEGSNYLEKIRGKVELKKKSFDRSLSADSREALRAVWEENEERIRSELEPGFRREIRGFLDEFAKKAFDLDKVRGEDRLKAIREFPESWEWIEKAYPSVNLFDAKVVFMTLQKALHSIDTIWGGTVSFSDDILGKKKVLVVVDEFDSCKEVIAEKLVSDACSGSSDVIAEIKNVKSRALDMDMPDKAFSPYDPDSSNREETALFWDDVSEARKEEAHMQAAVKKVYEKYGLHRSVLIDGGNVRKRRGFLFNDGGYRSSGGFVGVDEGSHIEFREAAALGRCPRCGEESAMRRFGNDILCAPATEGVEGCGYRMPALLNIGGEAVEIDDEDARRLFDGKASKVKKVVSRKTGCEWEAALLLDGEKLFFLSDDKSEPVSVSLFDIGAFYDKPAPSVFSARKFLSDVRYGGGHYPRFVGNSASRYCRSQEKKVERARKREKSDDWKPNRKLPVEELSIGKAVDIMLQYATLDQKGDLAHRSLKDAALRFVRNRSGRNLVAKWDESVIPSYYERGFGVYSVEAAGEIEKPPCRMIGYDIATSPEAVIFGFARKAKVVGLSATIATQTVLENFDMSYGRSLLGDGFIGLTDEENSRIEALVDEHFRGYNDGLIGMDARLVPMFQEPEKEFKLLFGDEYAAEQAWSLVETTASTIGNVKDEAFYLRRYCRVAWHMAEFVRDESYKAALNMMTTYPSQNKSKFSLGVLKDVYAWMLYDRAVAEYGADAAEKGMTAGEYRRRAEEEVVVLRKNETDGTSIKAALAEGADRFVMTTYQGFKIGVNLSYKAPKGVETVLTDYGRETYLKDFDGILFDRKTNIVPRIDRNEFKEAKDVDRIAMFLQFSLKSVSLRESHEISRATSKEAIEWAMDMLVTGGMSNGSFSMNASDLASVREAAAGAVAQAAGRGDRGARKTRKMRLYGDPDLLYGADGRKLLKDWRRRGMFVSPLLERLLSLYVGAGDDAELALRRLKNRKGQITSMAAWKIETVLMSINRGNASESDISDYDQIGESCLKRGFSLDEDEIGSMDEFKLYYEYEDERDSYALRLTSDTHEGWREAEVDELIPAGKSSRPVSVADFRMDELMAIPGLRDHFVDNGWKTEYKPSRYLLNAVMAKRILPGRLGEKAGEFVLESVGIRTERMPNEIYERFDSKLKDYPKCYVDYKFWNGAGSVDDGEMQIGKIGRKMDEIGAERVAVLNILPPKDSGPLESPWSVVDIGGGRKIFRAAHIVDRSGNVMGSVIAALGEFLADHREETD